MIALGVGLMTGTGIASATPDGSELESRIVERINAFELEPAARLVTRYEAEHGRDALSLYYRTRVAILTGELDRASEVSAGCTAEFAGASICHEARAEAAMVKLVVEGNVFKQLGAARTARRHLTRAVSLDPDNLRARLLLVRYYSLAPWFVGGSKSKAREQVNACTERDEFWGHEASAVLALAEHRYPEAITALRKAQALRPAERDPAYYLARAYVAAGETSAAIHVLESLVSRYPKFHDAWLELGMLAAERNVASARGMAALEHFLATVPAASRAKRIDAALALGRLYETAGRPGDAVATIRALHDEFPDARRLRKALDTLCQPDPRLPECAAG